MSQSSMMRSPSLEQIRALEADLNHPGQPDRCQAARRIFELGRSGEAGSEERNRAISALSARIGMERDESLHQELVRMVAELRGSGERAQRRETSEQGIAGRVAEAVVSRALGPLALIPRLAGCATTTYEGSVMSGEVGRVHDFTEELTRDDTTVEERVRTVVEWGQRNLPHFHGPYQPSVYGDNAESVEDVSIRDVFRERVVGCHHAVFVLVTMLRSIGINAEYIRSESIGAGPDGHGIMYVPEIDRYIHGDSVCLFSLVPTDITIETRENVIARHVEASSVDPYNPPESVGPVTDEFMSHVHSGGFLRRDGDTLYIEGGFVHAGYEETEFPRLQAMFPEYEITPGPARPDGLGTTFTTTYVPIVPLE